jgi:DNA-binding transcriptional regulator YhcF (GntR family)
MYFGKKTNATRASLSRAYKRLEERGFIIRTHGCFQLTMNPHNPASPDQGTLVAFNIWADYRQEWAALGFDEATLFKQLGIEPKE